MSVSDVEHCRNPEAQGGHPSLAAGTGGAQRLIYTPPPASIAAGNSAALLAVADDIVADERRSAVPGCAPSAIDAAAPGKAARRPPRR